MTTLADRIQDRMQATGTSNASLAKSAGVKQPTAHNWGSGKTRAIKGEPLLAAAAALGVTPKWLATGHGPKFPEHGKTPTVDEPAATHHTGDDAWLREANQILRDLHPEDRRAAVLNLRVFAQNLGPPRNGHRLPMAA